MFVYSIAYHPAQRQDKIQEHLKHLKIHTYYSQTQSMPKNALTLKEHDKSYKRELFYQFITPLNLTEKCQPYLIAATHK